MDALIARILTFHPEILRHGRRDESECEQKPRREKRSELRRGLKVLAGGGAVLGAATCGNWARRRNALDAPHSMAGLPFASATLALTGGAPAAGGATRKEPKTGLEFPLEADGKQLIAVGIRNKVLFGLKNIRVYAFGVYVGLGSVSKHFQADGGDVLRSALSADTELAVRLVISYKGLKIGQVRKAFESSVGEGIAAIKGQPDPELLSRFTEPFRDDLKLGHGAVITISRSPGHVLVTQVGGEEVGRVKSPALCQAFFGLYLGEKPFDKDARAEAEAFFSKA
eukprot:TRINITY_DN39314_c0_g1_i1.p1 TRINITY_DN39314_c0_g1~~TRINITY_DN39314_c0_g1_i1.p1  ORF type:complete len:306 (-),score=53.98 TRINITY_DN39314_c0_g1_i1:105-953(-)